MNKPDPLPWKVSLHGGHSGAYCDHAKGTLREVLEAAAAAGYAVFGVTEHAPRLGEEFLYEEERAMGWDVEKLAQDFERYARDLRALATEFEGRLTVLRGFEAEVVPEDEYAKIMTGYRKTFGFEYMVGSVHFVRGTLIDGPRHQFEKAADLEGGVENLAVAYYGVVAEMVENLRPEIVAHLDLIRRNAPSNESVESPRITAAAEEALAVIAKYGCILDVNTGGYRKGLKSPYPAPWLVEAAAARDIPFCFGDDSHGPDEVGTGVEEARDYLIGLGVNHITSLVREGGALAKKAVPLDS